MLSRAKLSAVLGGATLMLAVTLLLGGMAPLTGFAAAQVSNSTNVTLSVETQTSVSVTPTLFNFSGMTLGETNFSDRTDLVIQIENTGSTNITNIYAHPDTLQSEQNNPLGTGSAEQYASGRFLWIKNESSQMYHASALSWNMTESAGGEPSGITGKPSTTGGAVSEGFYRNATGNYLWSLGADSNGFCNSTSGVELIMKNSADTGDNRDLSSDSTTYGGASAPTIETANNDWGVVTDGSGNPVTSGPLEGHYIAIRDSCEKFMVYRFNDGSSASPAIPTPSGNGKYLVGPDGTSELTPGETHEARVGAAVPHGIPAGNTNRTLLTIHAVSGGS